MLSVIFYIVIKCWSDVSVSTVVGFFYLSLQLHELLNDTVVAI